MPTPFGVEAKVKNNDKSTSTTLALLAGEKKILKTTGCRQKRFSTIDIALRALELLQASGHNIDDSLRRTIIAGIMSKQSHDRERKASYRKQQREVEAVPNMIYKHSRMKLAFLRGVAGTPIPSENEKQPTIFSTSCISCQIQTYCAENGRR
ncbi:unnamed protein product [Phytophthora lilii]|uniref:Unnamed protein product n=1 Tax=Phytophthora lilii TaxID=2077276 RepID=A0A9W6TZK6_9STRA|nr:unnamed protein product [Phytophthora lilii]